MIEKGMTWNESLTHIDPIAGRNVRRITTAGTYNYKAPYHTRTTFTADGEYLIFATYRDGQSAICKAHVPTGDITVLNNPVSDREQPLSSERNRKGGDRHAFDITAATIAPESGWVFYWNDKTLESVNVDTLESRTIIDDIGPEQNGALVSVDPSESMIVSAVGPEHPDRLAGKEELRDFKECFPDGEGMFARFIEVPLKGGEPREIFFDEGIKCAHCEHSPVDPDLLLIDRDRPPRYWAGGDYSKSPRAHILRISTGELTPLTTRTESKFHMHATWSWDGEHVLYHGPAVYVEGPCPWFIGAAKKDGEIYKEWTFDDGRHYGHVGAPPDKDAIILDGNMSDDRLMWLYLDGDEPRFEEIARHDTEWKSIPGQLSHPHPSTDKQGRWIAFNTAHAGRSDVWVVEV